MYHDVLLVSQDFSWKETEEIFYVVFGMLFGVKLAGNSKEGSGLISVPGVCGVRAQKLVVCTLVGVKGRAKSASPALESDRAAQLEALFLINTLCSDANASVLVAN